jgi:nucleotide-binding universal stress UspA family protein
MSSIVISYDGTYNEDDAVALGRLFAAAGAEVALAYVRHTPAVEAGEEALAEHEAQELLLRGAALLGGREAGRHVVTDRSTPEGLRKLADQVGADAVVFCSDSHTAKGHIAIGNSARRLLEGGPLAVAIAPAGFAAQEQPRLQLIAHSGELGDGNAKATAEALAAATGASVSAVADERADLLVIGSRAEVEQGRVGISATAENLIEEIARCPVLVLPRGRELCFARGSDRGLEPTAEPSVV